MDHNQGIPAFNLITEAWIPCVMLEGTRYKKYLGLREVLAQAASIEEIIDGSPLVTASLHRLLLALIHRVLDGPKSVEEWAQIWSAGAFDMGLFDRYFETWSHRFDLFDQTYPWYQRVVLKNQPRSSVARLAHEKANGTSPAFFDHTMDDTGEFTPAQVARYLLAQQNFGLGSKTSVLAEDEGLGSSKNATLTGSAVVVVMGESLFETLLLNLHQYDPTRGIPFPTVKGHSDLPLWEQPAPSRVITRAPYGYLDYLTWESRGVFLLPVCSADGQTVVHQVVYSNANHVSKDFERERFEVMVAYKAKNNPKKDDPEPWVTVKFQLGRALWRDSLALLMSVAGEPSRPRMLTWLQQLMDTGVLDKGRDVRLNIFGLVQQGPKAKVNTWRHERVSLPLDYIANDRLLQALKVELSLAEQVNRALRDAVRLLAIVYTVPRAEDAEWNKAYQKKDNTTALSVRWEPPAQRTYWSQLGAPFTELLHDLSEAPIPETGLAPTAMEWRRILRVAATKALADVTRVLRQDARGLQAATKGSNQLGYALHRMLTVVNVAKEGEDATSESELTADTRDLGDEDS